MASRNNYFCGISTASTSACSLCAVSGGALRAAAAGASVRLGSLPGPSQSAEHKKGAQQLNIFALWSVVDQATYAAGIRIRHKHSADWPAVHADDDKPEEAHKHEMMSYADECWRCLVASLQLPLAELTDFDFNLQWPRPVPWNAKAKAKAKQKPKAKSQMDKQSDEATNVF